MDDDIKIVDGVVLPSSVNYHVNNDNQYDFIIKPLSAGFGTTLGNSLRRILLSYINGFAINYIKIPGVKHEFSTISGMMEDVVDLVLNLKQIRFKKKGKTSSENIKVKINKNVFLAGDIDQFSQNFEIVNKSFEVCHFVSLQSFEIELNVIEGAGWVPAQRFDPVNDEIGKIFIDSIFSPVKNVSIDISDSRVKQDVGYDTLKMTITTDGTISPFDAFNMAVKKLRDVFDFLLDPKLCSEDIAVDLICANIKDIKIEKLLNQKIEELGFSKRLLNCFSAEGLVYLKDVLVLTENELKKIPHFGDKSQKEFLDFLSEHGLKFGIDLNKYNL